MRPDYLLKQAERLLREVQEREQRKDEFAFVLYDVATGLPLPGYEPDPNALVQIWIPDNHREKLPGPYTG